MVAIVTSGCVGNPFSWRFGRTRRLVSVAIRIVKPFSSPEPVRMRRQLGAVAVLSAAAAVLSLAGCGGSSSTNPNTSNSFKSLPAAEQQYFESAAVEEITADVSSLTSLSPLSGFYDRVVPRRVNGAFRMMHSQRNMPRFQNDTSCYATTGDLTDPDNDG